MNPYNFNSALAVTAATVERLVFKNAAGVATRAKRIMLRFDYDPAAAAPVVPSRISYKFFAAKGLAASADPVAGSNMFVFPGEPMLTVEGDAIAEFRLYTADSDVVLYIDAYSDEDISGSEFV